MLCDYSSRTTPRLGVAIGELWHELPKNFRFSGPCMSLQCHSYSCEFLKTDYRLLLTRFAVLAPSECGSSLSGLPGASGLAGTRAEGLPLLPCLMA